MTRQKLRIGVIGIGWYAGTALIPRMRETGRAEIVAISRRNPGRLAQAQAELNVPAGYSDWREMLDKTELDAVVVSTPPNAHAEPTVARLERGLHVFVEKPIALSLTDARWRTSSQSISVVGGALGWAIAGVGGGALIQASGFAALYFACALCTLLAAGLLYAYLRLNSKQPAAMAEVVTLAAETVAPLGQPALDPGLAGVTTADETSLS